MPANKQLETSQLVKLEMGGGGVAAFRAVSIIARYTLSKHFFFLISLLSNYEGEDREIQVETKWDEYK